MGYRNHKLDVRSRSLDHLVDAAGVATCGGGNNSGDGCESFDVFAGSTPYSLVRRQIEDGDLLAFRTGGIVARHGRSLYGHVGTAVWRHADQATLLIAESRECHGGRVVTLSSQVRAFPGLIDVYRPTYHCPHGIRQRAATIALNWSGRAYDYPGAWRMALMHAPILRWLAECWNGKAYDPTDLTLSSWTEPKVCSQLHAWAYRLAAVELQIKCDWDPVPNLGDRWIEPGDLVRSGSYRMVAKGLVV